MADITRRFPPELLAEVLKHVSARDLLRFRQVNHTFRNILSTPLFQHRVHLFSIGLEYNAGAGTDLPAGQEALDKYYSNFYSLNPVEERGVPNTEYSDLNQRCTKVVGGVCAVIGDDSVRLTTLGSTSRGIPRKEWEIPLPVVDPVDYTLCPDANVIAFVKLQGMIDAPIGIHLRTLSDGKLHPVPQCPIIHYSLTQAVHKPFTMSMTSSRLALLITTLLTDYLIIWDWKSGRALVELEEELYDTMEFIDDYRLLVSIASTVDAPPSVVVMDTGKDEAGSPIQTIFHLSPYYINSGGLSILLEPGGHKPSPAESLAPFHQDSAQRIVVLDSFSVPQYIVLRVGALLEFHENHEGTTVPWDEWKSHAVIPVIDYEDVLTVWVSGCRLFLISVVDDGDCDSMTMFDFSAWGRVRSLCKGEGQRGIDRCLLPTGAIRDIPRYIPSYVQSGHDSIVFSSTPDEAVDDGLCVTYIWSF